MAAVLLLVLVAMVASATSVGAQSIFVGGQVSSTETVGLAGARVRLLPLEDPYTEARRRLAANESEHLGRTSTDARGLFRLRAPEQGGLVVEVEAPGTLPARVVLAPLVESVEIAPLALLPRHELTVTVHDGGGRPVPGAWVEADTADASDAPYYGPDSRWEAVSRLARTRTDGVATIPRAAGERIALRIVAAGFDDAAVETSESSVEVRLEAIPPARRRIVEARDPSGRARPGVLVRPAGARALLGVTGEDGRLTVGVAGASRQLELLGPDGLAASLRLEPPPSEASGQRPLAVALEPPRNVPVAVTDASTGQALPGAMVAFERRLPPRRTRHGVIFGGEIGPSLAETGAGGSAVLPISTLWGSQELLLRVAAPRYVSGRFALPDGGPGAPAEAPVALVRAAAVEGVVVLQTGEPLAAVEVEAEIDTSAAGITLETLSARSSRGRSGADGTFRLSGLLPYARYTLDARTAGFAPARATVDELEPFATHTGLRLVLTGGLQVTGLVLSEEGQPVSGAAVFLYEPLLPDQSMWMRNRESVEATTGDDGAFVLQPVTAGTWDLVVDTTGFALAVVRGVEILEGAGTHDLGTLHLAPGATIAGVVTDPDERPLAGARVRVMVQAGLARPGGTTEGSTVTTSGRAVLQDLGIVSDEEGRFAVTGLQPGEKVDLMIDLAGYLGEQIHGLEGPLEEPLTVVLEPGASIAGRVDGEGGRSVEGATVRVTTEARERGFPGWSRQHLQPVGTGEDGRFRIEAIPAGTWTVLAQADDYAPARREGVALDTGEALEDLVLTLDRGVVLEGRVVGAEDEPVAGARVSFSLGEVRTTEVTSGPDGAFRMREVPVGRGMAFASTQDGATAQREIEVEPGGTWVELRFSGLSLSGRVVDESGTGISGARIMLFPRTSPSSGRGQRSTTSGADGAFRVSRLAPDTYQVGLSRAGFSNRWREEPVTLTDTPITDLELVLRRGATLTGRVVGLSVDELAQVVIRAVGGASGTMAHGEGQADYEGRFEIPDLVPGSYTVHAFLQSRGLEATAEAEVAESGGTVEIAFEEGVTLSGLVTQNGEPLAQSTVNVQPLDRGPEPLGPRFALLDHQGRFSFSGLERGRYRVSIRDLHEEVVDLRDDEELRIDVVTAAVRGRIVDADTGEPLAGAVVTLRRLDDTSTDWDLRYRYPAQREEPASADGGFSFDAVSEGTYHLAASHDGYTAVERTLPVRGGAEMGGIELALVPAEEALRLEVRGPLGVPDSVTVGVLSQGGQAVAVRTYSPTGDGTVAVDVVPAGTWQLLVSAAGTATVETTVRVPGPTVPVALPAARTLTVRAPAFAESRATLTLTGQDGRPFRQLVQTALQDRFLLVRGQAQVTGLPHGSWALRVEGEDGSVLSGVASTEGGVTEVVLE